MEYKKRNNCSKVILKDVLERCRETSGDGT